MQKWTTQCRARSIWRVAATCLTGLALGCGPAPTEATVAPITMNFNVGPWLDPAVAYPASANSIGVRAAILRRCSGYYYEGAAQRTSRSVTLRVEGREPVGGCSLLVADTTFSYSAVVWDLPPGTWTLRVIHTHRTGGFAPDTVFADTVTIPASP